MRLLIITPTLGKSPYLDKTVDSVRAVEKMSGWEIKHILVAPTGGLDKLRAQYPELTLLGETGTTLYQAINQALIASHSDFDYWTYINDDDYLLQGFAEVLHRASFFNGPCVIYGKVVIINSVGDFTNKVTRWTLPRLMRGALGGGRSPLNQQGALWSKSVIERVGYFDPTLKYAADYDYFFRCANMRVCYQYVANNVAAYRVHAAQLGQDGGPFRHELDLVRERYKIATIYRFFCNTLFPLLNLDIYFWRVFRGRPFGTALFADAK